MPPHSDARAVTSEPGTLGTLDGSPLPSMGAPTAVPVNGSPAVPAIRALDPATAIACSVTLQVRRVTQSVIGRPTETTAIDAELRSAAGGRLTCLTFEGEPGIGKTRLLFAAAEVARSRGFAVVAVAADEEIRGPLLVARSLLSAPELREIAETSAILERLDQAIEAVSGVAAAGLESLTRDARLLRTYDLAAIALRSVAAVRPVALLVDDLQWADEDSLGLLRYVVRTDSSSPIFIGVTIRPEEMAQVREAAYLVADMERMGLVRRMRVNRFSQAETAEFISQLVGGPVRLPAAATIHAQAEGVPFILEELVRAYRDTGLLQLVDGTWTLSTNAEKLQLSAVRTLIQRRAARLPEETRATLGEAAVLGRSFSLRDLRAVHEILGEPAAEADVFVERLTPAVDAGLLVALPADMPADFAFTHGQVREFAASLIPASRQRAVHIAIVDLLAADEPSPASLSVMARHALAAGDGERTARYSIAAARVALDSHAPEEVLRLVEDALPVTSAAADRVALLQARDEALESLRRPNERLSGLAQLGALAQAMGDGHLELEVMLRRASALRLSDDYDAAAGLARRVGELADARADADAALEAAVELGQCLMRAPLGESYAPTGQDADFDGAERAFLRVEELARERGDERRLAAALRELGVIQAGRVRAWVVAEMLAGRGDSITTRVAAGEPLSAIVQSLPVAPQAMEAFGRFRDALDIYERLGDRRGVMSSVIAMAYLSWAGDIHFAGAAGRLEELRRLTSRMNSLVTESERAHAEVQMLFGVHVFGLAKVVPDLALLRGEEAYRAARTVGESTVEFQSALGMTRAHLELGDVAAASTWLEHAAQSCRDAPGPLRALQLESWRGRVAAAAGDPPGMRLHLLRSLELATNQGRAAARCEALATLALEAARMGVEGRDEELLELAERSAIDAIEIAQTLTGRPPWTWQASAARGSVQLARGDSEAAVASARASLSGLLGSHVEDLHFEIVLPVAEILAAGGTDDEKARMRAFLRMQVALFAQRVADDTIRSRWLRGPVGARLVALAGPLEGSRSQSVPVAVVPQPADGAAAPVGAVQPLDLAILRQMTQGATNGEIAAALGVSAPEVAQRIAGMAAQLGSTSRADATLYAFGMV